LYSLRKVEFFMRDIEIGSRKFDISDELERESMVCDHNFSYDHYCLDDGVATVGGGKIGDKLYFTISFCAPNDNFSRRIGRDNVCDNFVSEDCSHRRAVIDISSMKDNPPTLVLAYALMEYLKRGKCVPQWARNGVVSFRNNQRIGARTGTEAIGRLCPR